MRWLVVLLLLQNPLCAGVLDDQLRTETPQKKAETKSILIATITPETFSESKTGIEVEILDIQKIQVNGQHGVEIFAKATRNGEPLGFGSDGSIEIERFRIFNPPVLVPDLAGDVVREWFDEDTKGLVQARFREDPQEALRLTLAHTISLVGKEGTPISKGKVGKTTDTYFPIDAADGSVQEGPGDGTDAGDFATIRAAGGDSAISNATSGNVPQIKSVTATPINDYTNMNRTLFIFDTSGISAGDTITSATLSIFGASTLSNGLGETSYEVAGAVTAANTTLTGADYAGVLRVSFGSIAYTSWSVIAYNDFVLSAAGIANINKGVGAYSKFSGQLGWDLNNSFGGLWVAGTAVTRLPTTFADTVGTSSDPKLVIVHESASFGTINNPVRL